jgi:hypothetical protein
MGTIESIQEIIAPVSQCLQAHYRISYDLCQNTTGILFENFYKAQDTHLLWLVDNNNRVTMYFLACPIPPLYDLPWWDIPVARKQITFFNGPDVFQYLGILYTCESKEYPENLKALVSIICANASQIISAFSSENRQKTFDVLNEIEATNHKKAS